MKYSSYCNDHHALCDSKLHMQLSVTTCTHGDNTLVLENLSTWCSERNCSISGTVYI